MTLSIATSINGVPLVLGDALLSGPERQGEVSMPTVGDSRNIFPAGSGYSIVGLSQKATIISPDCALAWAGGEIHARLVCQELKALADVGRLTTATLDDYFHKLPPDFRRLGIVGWIRDGNGFRRFGQNFVRSEHPFLGSAILAGSGAERLGSLTIGMDEHRVISGKPDPFARTIATALSVTGTLLQLEQISFDTWTHYFGGAYEIIAPLQGHFSKVDDVSYVFWLAEVSGEAVKIGLPNCVLKLRYVGDVLEIRVLRIVLNEGPRPAYQAEVHVVGPMYRSVDPEEATLVHQSQPDLNARLTCHHVWANFGSGLEIFSHVEYRQNREPESIRISSTADGFDVAVKPDFLRKLARSIAERRAGTLGRSR